jgi:hypothetical protein
MRTRLNAALTLGAVVAVAAFVVVTLVLYKGRPTPGAVFLTLGWLSILATGYFLVRAVASFDLTTRDDGHELPTRRDDLEREKKHLLKAIKEVEFDRDTGKLDGGEAKAAISRYRARAVEILRLLDSKAAPQYEAIIASELARRMGPADPDDARRCAACSTLNDDDASFCKKCGAKMKAAAQ